MAYSVDGSNLDSTLNNPYEYVFKFMQDSEENPRIIDEVKKILLKYIIFV